MRRKDVSERSALATIEEIDRDGILQEALDGLFGTTRARFLRRAVVGSATLLGALTSPGEEASARAGDTAVLNYGLAFEYMQAGFYTEAERVGTVKRMGPERALWARTLGAHERAHVRILKRILGKDAERKPSFNYRGVTESAHRFTRTAVAMEDLTVALLAGQAPRMSDRRLRAAFFSLLAVEARHAAWARRITGFVPVADALDEPKTLEAVNRVVRSTHFIVPRPKTSERGRPRFTG
jgi:hypothetical protein